MVSNQELAKKYIKFGKNSKTLTAWLENRCYSIDVPLWVKQFNRRWVKNPSEIRFLERNKVWLQADVQLPNVCSDDVMPSMPPDSNSEIKTNSPQSREKTSNKPGRKVKTFESLHVRTKHDKARAIAKSHDFDALLMAAEKAARSCGKTKTAEVLKNLINCSEEYAASLLKAPKQAVSIESSLSLKNELSLSKSKYSTVSRYLKSEFGSVVLQPWNKIIDYRRGTIPKYVKPDRSLGFLAVRTTLKDMIETHLSRLFDSNPSILQQISTASNGCNDIEIVLRITGGIDSATGFSQYNQSTSLGEDSSLLVSNFMLLAIELKSGDSIWLNPRPRSNSMVRPLMMAWTKETAEITLSVYQKFMTEAREINDNPFTLKHGPIAVIINIIPSYTLIDGKAANAIIGNKNTHKCPLCCCDSETIGPSYMHSTMNAVEWLIKHRAKTVINGSSLKSPEVIEKTKQFSKNLEQEFGVQVNRAQPGGSGNSNTGNMAKRLLSRPSAMAKCLDMDMPDSIEGLRLLSVLSCSSSKLNEKRIQEHYKKTIAALRKVVNLKEIPPCIEKYRHMGELSHKLPLPLSFYSEEAGESSHRRHKMNRLYASRKVSPEANLEDMFVAALSWSDPFVADCVAKRSVKEKMSKRDPEFNLQLKTYFVENDIAESDSGESDSDLTDTEDM